MLQQPRLKQGPTSKGYDPVKSRQVPPPTRVLKKNEIDLPDKRDWKKSQLFRMGVRLVNATEDASYPVMILVDDIYYPLCEDSFNDQTAQALCEMYFYERGYKTTYTLADDAEFSFTNLECYQTQWTEQVYDDSFNRTYCRKAVQKCLMKDYSDKDATGVLPCSRNQAAGVHCYDLARAITWTPNAENFLISKKTWSITFSMDIFKLGKKETHFSAYLLRKFLDFSFEEFVIAYSCGKESTPDLRYISSAGQDYFELNGKFRRNCKECEDLYMFSDSLKDYTYFWTVCQQD
ncbi:hypothetical protein ACHWQZ_G016155 [Mnemiopsis leidyi]